MSQHFQRSRYVRASHRRDARTTAGLKHRAIRIRRDALAGSALMLMMALSATAHAQSTLPTGGTVVSGSATIATGPAGVTVTQTSSRGIVNWSSFDVGQGKTVIFTQPSANSATLNRVTGTAASTISGTITSNGAVYLVNPNGIAITPDGTVRTGGGFVASTLDIADADFNAGRLKFVGTGASAGVSNAGRIKGSVGSYVALLGGTVSNGGTIEVALGKVALGSGERITLDLNGGGFMQVAVPTSAITGSNTALIEMAGTIAAAGGRVEIKAATARDAVRNVVNLSGVISADSAIGDGGTIMLLGGDGGTVNVTGTLSARAIGASGNGGFIETSGAQVNFTGLKVDTSARTGRTGTWLIDPTNLTVGSSAAATISGNLASSNVTLQTTSTTASGPGTQSPGNGDITINNAITWSSSNSLSLLAYNNINLNAAITGTAGGLTLTAGNAVANTGAITATGAVNVGTFNLTNGAWTQNSATLPSFSATDFRFNPANATFLRVTGGSGTGGAPYQIADVYGLQGIASSTLLASNFAVANAIDASGTASWNSGAGFVPIGTDGAGNIWNGSSFAGGVAQGFTGALNGNSYAIRNLTINRSTTAVGLVGQASGNASLSNITLTGVNIVGGSSTGAILGRENSGSPSTLVSLSNDSVTGSVSGNGFVGGLAGNFTFGSISDSHANVDVTGTGGGVGGLVGSSDYGTMLNDYATGNVTMTGTAGGGVGGLIGVAGGSVTNSYASGNVSSGSSYVGGLIGYATGSVSNSYASGTVRGYDYVGGLTGTAATISSSYATGTVTATSSLDPYAGGLTGQASGAISLSYATGAVTAPGGHAGGLIGYSSSSATVVTQSYATGLVSASGGYAGGLIGGLSAGTIGATNYWDNYSTGVSSAYGAKTGGTVSATAVTSDPAQASAANYAYKASAYGNFTATQWVFFDGQTRPFGAWEVPASGSTIVNSHQLQLIGANAASQAGSYTLGANIDLAETGKVAVGAAGSYAGMWTGAGFVPIGTDGIGNTWDGSSFKALASITSGTYGFTGTLDGAGYSATGLSINRGTIRNVGLFGLSSGTIQNIGVTGTVIGANGTGGLVGMLYTGGAISGSSSAVNATGANFVGSLVGQQIAGTTITLSSASGTASGVDDVGGLVGYVSGGTISRSSASGGASGAHYVGGLLGYAGQVTLSNSYATGSANASVNSAGGLIGKLVNGSVTNTYSTGVVSGPATIGGLIGQSSGSTVTSSYWDTTTSGQSTSAGGSGRTDAQMKTQSTYTGWDFTHIWIIGVGGYPVLAKTP